MLENCELQTANCKTKRNETKPNETHCAQQFMANIQQQRKRKKKEKQIQAELFAAA